MISYKPAIWQHVVGILIIFMLIVVISAQANSGPISGLGSSSSQYSRPTQETLTYEEAERSYMLGRSSMSETPEEHRKNVQAFADLYNENLERRQKETDISSSEWSDETRKEIRETLQPVVYLSIGFLGVLIILLVLRLFQDYVLKITPQGIWIKKFPIAAATEIPFSDMTTIRYRIRHDYNTDNGSGRLYRILTFENNGTVLGKINLNDIADADFNTLQNQISQVAPHLKWIYPK